MGKIYTRVKTNDVAYQFRMGAGFAGDVNRTHPASIEPVLIDASAPPTAYGQAVLIDPTTQGVRPFASGDTAVTIANGVTVRPYPFQQPSTTNYGSIGFGSGTPPTSGVMDILRQGYISAQVVGSPVKGGAVYVWCAASTGSHVQGGFEAAASAGNTAALANAKFNGPADSTGVAEIVFGFNA